MIESMHAIPRVLADDILLTEDFKEAFTATHTYLQDLGAKLAPKKSLTFAAKANHRRKLKKYRWPAVGDTIKVLFRQSTLCV